MVAYPVTAMPQPQPPQDDDEYVTSSDGAMRAVITQRRDGLFSIEIERHGVENAKEYGKFEYWASVSTSAIIVDTIERARAAAVEELRAAGAMVPLTSSEVSR